MKPMGRTYYKGRDSKHNIKVDGKTLYWWSDICHASKKKDKELARKEINSHTHTNCSKGIEDEKHTFNNRR